MTDLNKVILVGNLVKDMEMKYTQGGMAIGSFSIACNRSKKGQDGKYVDDTSYFNVSLFGKMAESLQQYLKKGKKIALDGSLRQERWQDQQGNKASRVSIVVDNIQILSSNQNKQNGFQNDGYQNSQPQQPAQPQIYSSAQEMSAADAVSQGQFSEDIPF